MRPGAGPWFVVGWACLAVLLLLGARVAGRVLFVCRADLVPVPEPAAWRHWPLGHDAIFEDACRGRAPATRPTDSWTRRDPDTGVFVVVAAPGHDDLPNERFLSAFRPEPVSRLAYTSRAGFACVALLALALVVQVAGLLRAARSARAEAAAAAGARQPRPPRSDRPYRLPGAPPRGTQENDPAAEAGARARATLRRACLVSILAVGLAGAVIVLGGVALT